MRRGLFMLLPFVFVGWASQAPAADITIPMAGGPPYVLVPNWTGLYLGINGGYGWAHGKVSVTSGGLSVSSSDDFEGALGGGQIGYNWQQGSIVLGVEADAQITDQHHTINFGGTASLTNSIPWFGTVRGRLGFAVDRFLVYGTGGLAYGQFKTELSWPGTASGTLNTAWTAWTAGGGVEAALYGHWTARVEYLYIDTGNFVQLSASGPAVGNLSANVSGSDQIVRAGVNYRW